MTIRIGFIGFGEAAFNIAKGLSGEGVESIFAYDKFWNVEPQAALIRQRATEARTTLATSLAELIGAVDIVVSAVSANLVVPIASESVAYLRNEQLYVDLNSAAPATKVAASQIIGDRALFVDAAVMGPVPGNGHKAPILASGVGSEKFCELMTPFGMNITVMPGPVGGSSASKMFRSIFMKGFVMLLLETVIASHKYGIEDDVLASIEETLTAEPFAKLANGLLARGVIHSERREHEMDEVIATLKSIGVDSIMSEASKRKLHWCTDQNLKQHFQGVPPKDFRDILAVLESQTK
jgi:3-hydroxyisobutyrate dehydrogenase-like beta-hydroxyacid dehydrogenase